MLIHGFVYYIIYVINVNYLEYLVKGSSLERSIKNFPFRFTLQFKIAGPLRVKARLDLVETCTTLPQFSRVQISELESRGKTMV